MAAKKTTTKTKTNGPASSAEGLPIAGIGGTDVATVEKTLQKEYPQEWAFWHSDPDLQKFLEENLSTIVALENGSTEAQNKLSIAFQKSTWYNKENNGPNLLEANLAEYTQPQTWKASLANRETDIRNIATEMGYQLDDSQLAKIADQSLKGIIYNGDIIGNTTYNDKVRTLISQTVNVQKASQPIGKSNTATTLTGAGGTTGAADANNPLNGPGGAIYDTEQQLIDYNTQMGNPYSQQWISDVAKKIADPSSGTTLNTYKGMIKSAAAQKYPGFATQIDNNVTLQSIADPFISSMTNLLELPYSSDNWSTYLKDPLLQKGLQGTINPDGTATPMTNYNFENMVRQDPRWAYTNNARDSVNGILHQIGKDMGFVS